MLLLIIQNQMKKNKRICLYIFKGGLLGRIKQIIINYIENNVIKAKI